MIAPTHWIKKNMMGTYSEALGRPLTEAEVRVQRCLEQMPVPDWYRTYKKPYKFLKNDTPIECRPASWKTYKQSKTNSNQTPRKTSRKKSFRSTPSPLKSESESSRTSTADSGFNDACRDYHRPPLKDKKKATISTATYASSSSESDTPKLDEDIPLLFNVSSIKSPRSPLNISNSYPRVSRSRKIENINIVFPKPFPAENDVVPEKKASTQPRTVYTMTKNFEMQRDKDCQDTARNPQAKTHASFLIADVEPKGVRTLMKVFAGPLTSDSSDEDQPKRSSPSPETRFFNSAKKSTELEKIVQRRRTDSKSRSFIQEIIDELDRSHISARSRYLAESSQTLSPEAQSFVRNMANALGQSCCYNSEEEEYDRRSNGSSDSELAKSTSISFKSYDSDQPSSPPPPGDCCSSSGDEEVYWIPCKTVQLPRTSSQLSMMSKGSSRLGRNSPGLSPIKTERREDWLQRQGVCVNAKGNEKARQLFRIDETGVLDSGYSDRSTTVSSRTLTMSSISSNRRSSSTPSSTPSPTLLNYELSRLAKSEAFVMNSFLV